jgi:hypothetical protein
VAGRAVDGFALSRGRSRTQAIIGSAQMRAALHDAPLGRAAFACVAARRFGRVGARTPQARRPLPDIADHVVQAESIGRERIDRRCACVSVLGEVFMGKAALPGVGEKAPFRIGGIAPGIGLAFESAARGELPFGFGRQFLAGPGRIGQRIFITDMNDRMTVAAGERAVRSFGMPPIRARPVFPPGETVAQADRPVRLLEHQRARHQQCGIGIGIHVPARRALRISDISGRRDEPGKFGIGDGVFVHPEAVDDGRTRRPLFSIETVRAHQKIAAGDPDHRSPLPNIGNGNATVEPSAPTVRDAEITGADIVSYLAYCFGTKSSVEPGGINSSFFTLSSKSRTMRWACCITHQRT